MAWGRAKVSQRASYGLLDSALVCQVFFDSVHQCCLSKVLDGGVMLCWGIESVRLDHEQDRGQNDR